MVVAKLLERKGIIRLFGASLVLAPFFNIVMSMSLQTSIADRWTWKIFWKIISTSSTFDHVLYIMSFLIGLIMLKGASTAWKWVLVLLGGVIANQTANLGSSFRANWMSIPFFIVNVSTFLFILDQLVWKQNKTSEPAAKASPPPPQSKSELAPAPKQQPTNSKQSPPTALTTSQVQVHQSISSQSISWQTHKRVFISFAGTGPWAQLIGISKDGMHVRCLKQPPADIHSREIEIFFQNGLNLHLRLNRQSGENFHFDYLNLSTDDIRRLNQWLHQQAA